MTICISPRSHNEEIKTQKTTNLKHILSVLILGRNGRDSNSVSQSLLNSLVARRHHPGRGFGSHVRSMNEADESSTLDYKEQEYVSFKPWDN